jgi:hypothetical protein
VAHHLVLPALTLGIVYLAQYSRLARASMLEVLGSDYIRTARAKGLSDRMVTFKHALRNALMPIVTIAGLQFGNLISGAVLVETVFSWPGPGHAGAGRHPRPRLPHAAGRADLLGHPGDRGQPADRPELPLDRPAAARTMTTPPKRAPPPEGAPPAARQSRFRGPLPFRPD